MSHSDGRVDVYTLHSRHHIYNTIQHTLLSEGLHVLGVCERDVVKGKSRNNGEIVFLFLFFFFSCSVHIIFVLSTIVLYEWGKVGATSNFRFTYQTEFYFVLSF